MERVQKRLQIINACISLQQKVAKTARQEMDSAQQQSNDYGANVDRYDSFRTKMMRMRDMYGKQLSIANANIRVLQEAVRHAPFDVAEHGAIVITDRQRFFLIAGIGKFLVPYQSSEAEPQEVYYAISAQTPIYMALRGKVVGDSLIFNGMTHVIREIL